MLFTNENENNIVNNYITFSTIRQVFFTQNESVKLYSYNIHRYDI